MSCCAFLLTIQGDRVQHNNHIPSSGIRQDLLEVFQKYEHWLLVLFPCAPGFVPVIRKGIAPVEWHNCSISHIRRKPMKQHSTTPPWRLSNATFDCNDVALMATFVFTKPSLCRNHMRARNPDIQPIKESPARWFCVDEPDVHI